MLLVLVTECDHRFIHKRSLCQKILDYALCHWVETVINENYLLCYFKLKYIWHVWTVILCKIYNFQWHIILNVHVLFVFYIIYELTWSFWWFFYETYVHFCFFHIYRHHTLLILMESKVFRFSWCNIIFNRIKIFCFK